MTGKPFSVGVDVGGTNIKFCVADEHGSIRSQHRTKTPTNVGCDGIIEGIVAGIPIVLEGASLALSQINSIGLGIPGTVDPERGVIVFAPNIFAVNVEIVKAIQRFYDLPVYLSQDSQAAAWGEYIVGAGKGLSSVVSITLGTGIGCGMVIHGKIYHGALNNTAGELGHQIVEIDGVRCNCGRQGCLETYVGGPAIVRAAKESIVGICDLIGKSADVVTAEDVFNLARRGNAAAKCIVDNVVKYLGIGLVGLANLISPDLISVSGGISNAPEELLFNPLVEFVRRRAYPTISEMIRICKSPLGGDAPLVGVAMLHRQSDVYSVTEAGYRR
jgi:glucokinase